MECNMNTNCEYCNKIVKKKGVKTHQKTKTCLAKRKTETETSLTFSAEDFNSLLEDGVIVIPGPKDIQSSLKTFLNDQIEFVPGADLFVMGSFGALGNPSSFHHPDILEIRQKVYDHVRPVFRNTGGFKDKNLEMLFDRFCVRKENTKLTGESWHRDIGNGADTRF